MPLSEDQYRAIGRITVLSAQLEFTANLLAWALINPNRELIQYSDVYEIGHRAFGGDNFASLVKKIQRLSGYVLRRSPQTLAEVVAWATKARDLQERRNEIIHALWSDPSTGEPTPYRLGRGEPRAARTRVDQLDQFADEIEAAIKEIAPALREISFPRYPP
jgi:hypothetical protein